MGETVHYYRNRDGYGIIILDRIKKHNAISRQMAEDFRNSLKIASQDQIKFLIVTGAGEKMFCSGGDLSDLHGDLSPNDAFERLVEIKEILYSLVTFPVPTICLLNGNALGGGCEVATACDFRIAKESTMFGFVQTKLGIIPGWGGGELLYKKVHSSFAIQWLLEAETYSASYLLQQGWLHNVVSKDKWNDQMDVLGPFLSKSYEQMRVLKDQYKENLDINLLSEQMEKEVRRCANLWDSDEHIQAVRHFFNRK
ncbi:enoyl-CoA hydratase/isomerase family protein [Ornithinibacillus sp. L9]|uniref:Enoyl-CoA hydratase/isomerase family protein n=1 Tax=Ornithinibacillus caprae TaxID=2678566 RepID=A0A6N8FJF7_9BACI|nr:enoyl-CoA hydratase/isomerase family protein [Ornithinibacillus caprae]MUK89543.1 enoyl-CoA hydratase/isomerase family protein [Ornithinibacillus caprae]